MVILFRSEIIEDFPIVMFKLNSTFKIKLSLNNGLNIRLVYVASLADICSLGHNNKGNLVGELLTLMARDQHTSEVCENCEN